MVHLLPLPGSEDYRGGLGPIREQALAEAHTLAAGGVDAIILQNSGDLPPAPEGEPETIASMSVTGAGRIAIAADLNDRTSTPSGALPIEVAANLALRHGHADALIVTGYSVGDSLARMRAIKAALPGAVVLAGGGATADNVGRFLEWCDGVIVGSSIKDTGHVVGTVDPGRLAAFMESVVAARGNR